jgi:hypothetical protein
MSVVSRRFFVSGAIFLGAIAVYYGLFFGAPHFLARYVSPLSIFLWTASCVCGLAVLGALLRTPQRIRAGMVVLVALLGLSSGAWAGMVFARGTAGMHKQVVDWVRAKVPPSAWVGAVQTGTLGYFHDRTVNLDGKVNPGALRASLREGNVFNYVLDSKIDYLADWVGIGTWVSQTQSPRFTQEFELIVKDEKNNLAVLRRITPRRGQSGVN